MTKQFLFRTTLPLKKETMLFTDQHVTMLIIPVKMQLCLRLKLLVQENVLQNGELYRNKLSREKMSLECYCTVMQKMLIGMDHNLILLMQEQEHLTKVLLLFKFVRQLLLVWLGHYRIQVQVWYNATKWISRDVFKFNNLTLVQFEDTIQIGIH